jgi:hypothetical protein
MAKDKESIEEARKMQQECNDSLEKYLDENGVHLIFCETKFMLIDNETNKVVRASSKDGITDFFKAEGIFGGLPNIKMAVIGCLQNVSAMTFLPAYESRKEFITLDYNGGLQQWNTFMPNIYARLYYNNNSIEPPYLFPKLDEYFDLFFEDEHEKKWFLHRIAAMMRHPEKRLPTSLILHGVQGSGKDTLRCILERLLGRDFVSNIDGKNILSQFNSYVAEKLVVFANEVFNWDKRTEIENFLKNYVTNDRITVNKKFMPEYTVDNFAFWIFATNDMNFVPFDEGDRRYSYFYQGESLNCRFMEKYGLESEREAYIKHTKPLIDYIKDYENAGSMDEFHQLYCYLMSIEIDWGLISHPLWTKEKLETIKMKFEHNDYYRILKEVLLYERLHIKDFKGRKFMEYAKVYDGFMDRIPPSAKKMGKHKFSKKCVGLGLLGKAETRSFDSDKMYVFEIKSKIILDEIFPPKEELPKTPKYEKGTLKEEKPNIGIPDLEKEDDGARYEGL